jgi:hypothetical protein
MMVYRRGRCSTKMMATSEGGRLVTKFEESSDVAKCSFCGKSQKEVGRLIAGPGVYICDECVKLCNDITEEEVVNTPSGAETPASPPSDDTRRWLEAQQTLAERLGRRPTVSELAAELGWTAERVTAVGRARWAARDGAGLARTRPAGMTGELRGVQRQLDQLAWRVAVLVEQAGEDDRVETVIASGTSADGMNSGPRPPTRLFPDVASLPEVQPEHRVQLHYDHGDDRLIGTLGDEPVEWHLARHHRVSGRIGVAGLEASWTTGDNYVPEPRGWAPRSDYVSDFPNIPADLSGSFADLDAELHGVFRLAPNYAFQRGSVVGRIGAVHLEATVLAASGGLSDSRTVAVEGTYGSVNFEIYATIDGGLSQGMLHGRVGEAIVHLDISRSSVERSVRPGYPPIDLPGPQIDLSGSYHGPPELLAIMVGAVLEFL